MFVYVLNKHDKPLMPCKPRKARILLKQKKAKVIKQTPFTIKLLYGSSGYKQDITLGVDAGSKNIGLSATTDSYELFKATVELRGDISSLMESRRNQRRSRRNRKTRYRPARFNNRGKKGKLAPSIQHKLDSHITIINEIYSILPITRLNVEGGEFDPHKLKNPDIHGEDYQNGEGKGFYNIKQAVLHRDNYTCQSCLKKDTKLQVHHIIYKSNGGSNSMDNLVTLCKHCHQKIHNENLKFDKKVKSFKHAAHMNIMRKQLIKRLKKEHDNVHESYGYETKYYRDKQGINKSHSNDAYIIAHNFNAKTLNQEYLYKKTRRHNRQIHKSKPSKGGKRKRNQSPYIINGFRRYDKVKYNNQTCFITGKRSTGYFQLKLFDGTTVTQGVNSKKLKLIEPVKGWIKDWRTAIPLCPKEDTVSSP